MNLEELGDSLREARMRAGLSQSEAARLSGLSLSTVRRIESDLGRRVRLHAIEDYARALGISLTVVANSAGVDESGDTKALQLVQQRGAPVHPSEGKPYLVRLDLVRRLLASSTPKQAAGLVIEYKGNLFVGDLVARATEGSVWVDKDSAMLVEELIQRHVDRMRKA